MSKKISEMPAKLGLVGADLFTIVDSEEVDAALRNKRITSSLAFSGLASDADVTQVQTNLDTHAADTANPHSTDKADVGLGNVDNTADLAKPVSTATQTALDGKPDHAPNDGQHKLRLYQSWANAGAAALLDVGVGPGDVAAGDAPAAAVAGHEGSYTHTNLPTNAQKSALDGAAAPSGGNPFATIADVTGPTAPEGVDVKSTGIGAGLRLTADGDDTSSWQPDIDISGKADKSTGVSAGVGLALTGPGDLSGAFSFALNDTGITPGAYTSPDLTVDAQGRITLIANGGISCGIGVSTCAFIVDTDPTGTESVKDGDIWIPIAPGPEGAIYFRRNNQWIDVMDRANHFGNILNAKLVGYEEELNVANNGALDFTNANFFTVTPTGNITLVPTVGSLTVCSATIHVDNTAGVTVTMPAGSVWVGDTPILPTKYAITLYTINGGTNWFMTFVGELP